MKRKSFPLKFYICRSGEVHYFVWIKDLRIDIDDGSWERAANIGSIELIMIESRRIDGSEFEIEDRDSMICYSVRLSFYQLTFTMCRKTSPFGQRCV